MTKRKIDIFDLGILTAVVLFLVAMLLPWERATATNGTVTRTASINGFHESSPRIAFFLFLLGAAWIVLRAFGVNFRRNISRSFVAVVDVGLPGALAVVGFVVASNDVGDVTDLPGISVDASIGPGAILGLVVGVAAIGLAVLVLLAERKRPAPQAIAPQFGTGPTSYVQGEPTQDPSEQSRTSPSVE